MSSFAVLCLPCEALASWTPSLEGYAQGGVGWCAGSAAHTQRWQHWPFPYPAWAITPNMADPGGWGRCLPTALAAILAPPHGYPGAGCLLELQGHADYLKKPKHHSSVLWVFSRQCKTRFFSKKWKSETQKDDPVKRLSCERSLSPGTRRISSCLCILCKAKPPSHCSRGWLSLSQWHPVFDLRTLRCPSECTSYLWWLLGLSCSLHLD